MKLTPSQRRGLERLIALQKQYGFTRWTTIHIGQSGARALRSLEGTGLVEIDSRQSNMYHYRITDAGRSAVETCGGEDA
jgi:DNA-binding PadR family transcriptional regulator